MQPVLRRIQLDAAEKAKDKVEITKLNSLISSEEKKIQQYFQEIGEIIFQQEKENPDSPVAELCNKVLAAQQTIERIKQEIIQIKEDQFRIKAPQLGAQIADLLPVPKHKSCQQRLIKNLCKWQ